MKVRETVTDLGGCVALGWDAAGGGDPEAEAEAWPVPSARAGTRWLERGKRVPVHEG